MKAAVLKEFGSPLAVETLPDPVVATGEVVVDVAAAGVLPYASEIFSGARKYCWICLWRPAPARSAACAR